MEVFIVGGARTPMCNLLGDASALSAPELGGAAIKGALEKTGVKPELIEEVVMGCVLPHGTKQAPARQAAINAGLDFSVPCTTVNKMCGSGMKATMMIHDSIKAGSFDIGIAGGMESMSNAPHMVINSRKGQRLGHGKYVDSMFYDGLEDAYDGNLMGYFAQQTADKFNFSRQDMDDYAILSARRALESTVEDEIAALRFEVRGKSVVVDRDEQPGKIKLDKIPTLKAAFTKDGTVTAANSSCISDGASALILAGEQSCKAQGLNPAARIVGHSSHARVPAEFTIAPAFAMEKLMQKLGWNKDDIDLFEINEAFAVVTLYSIRHLNLDTAKVNIRGGACSQGHPVGSSGSRILLTLINSLKATGGKRGMAGICIGGGEATALAVELV